MGWHYVYGYDPVGEASIAVSQMKKYSLDGYVIDAEVEYKLAGRAAVADTFMSKLRAGLPSTPVALCSFRWPTYHPQFPWTNFLNKCDYNMPQVYWMGATDAGAQLARSLKEFKNITPFRPLVPTGPAFSESGWYPTVSEVLQFLDTAKSLGMTAANFFSWDDCRRSLPTLWTAISNYSWPWTKPVDPVKDVSEKFIAALNSKNLDSIMALYTDNCIHIDSYSTIQGTANVRSYFSNLLNTKLPGATFTLGTVTGTGTNRSFTWTATSSTAKVTDGSDTFGLNSDKIAYHYSFYNITV
jgi:ketosteroid isomerase-like protein